jgi:hypothetical protein
VVAARRGEATRYGAVRKGAVGSTSVMPVRNLFPLAAVLVGTGCSDPGSVCNQSAMLAGMPVAAVETLSRACGAPRRDVVPTVAESGDVWPQPPDHVPTSLELLRATPSAERSAGAAQAIRHARGYGLCRPISRPPGAVTSAPAPPGVALGLCYAPAIRGAAEGRTGPG